MRRLPVLLTLAFIAAAAPPLAAQVTTALTPTSGQNALTASAVINGISSAAQAAGANVTQWTGTITVQVDHAFNPTTLTILSANIVAQDSGTWQLGLNGAARATTDSSSQPTQPATSSRRCATLRPRCRARLSRFPA